LKAQNQIQITKDKAVRGILLLKFQWANFEEQIDILKSVVYKQETVIDNFDVERAEWESQKIYYKQMIQISQPEWYQSLMFDVIFFLTGLAVGVAIIMID
jgi:hypothetical protein